MDGYDIWGSRELRSFEIYGIRNNDEVIAYVIIEEASIDGANKLRELWVDPTFRGKSLAACLLLFLLRKLQLKLLISHDEVVSLQARDFILKSLRASKFKALSRDGNELSHDLVAKMFSQLGKTDDELILTEERVSWYLFGDTTLLKEPWYARGEDLD